MGIRWTHGQTTRRIAKHRRRRRCLESLEARTVLDSTLVINEIMYQPAVAPEANYEWVELFNQMSISLDVSGWQIRGGIDYTFPQGTVVPGRSFIVVASNPTVLASSGIYAGAYGPFSGALSNGGEELELVNRDGRSLSVVEYDDGGDWPAGPDGSGFSLAKQDAYSSTSDAASWTTSRQFNGTPGAVNFPAGAASGPEIAFNEISAAGGSGFWVEIVNRGTTNVPVGGYQIGTSGSSSSTYTLPVQTLAPGELLLVNQAQLGFGGANNDKLFLYTPGKDRLIDARAVSNRTQGLAAGQGDQWLYPDVATPGTANSFALQTDIVINEIMYHAMPILPTTPTYETSKLLAIDSTTGWRYNQSGVNLGSTWAQTAHAGAGWSNGASLLAFEGGPLPYPVRTVLDDPLVTGPGDPFVATTYFETEFTFNGDLSTISELALGHFIDDGAVFYLNGVEVLRYNMPGGTISSSTFASSNIEASYVGMIPISKSTLVQGTNRLSVEVHQSVAHSTDIVFGAEVFVTTISAPGGGVFQESDEEWLELYNRGTSAVDLSGWSLADGIEYTFAPGTVIPAGGYLVVSNDATALRAKYPSATIVGNFSKSLSNSSDRLLLLDAHQNPADEVRYYDSGYWSELADGGGSSLELSSPDADNSKPEVWSASDERNDGEWHNFKLVATASTDTGPGIWNEFLFGMLDSGEVYVDDVSVIENPGTSTAKQLIQNGSFQADTLGNAPGKWRIIGNHHGQVVADPDDPANKVLNLRATGRTDHQGNNAGTTFVGNTAIVNGRVYEISFRARWIGGSNQLNARFYLSRVAKTFILPASDRAGTPGAQNSNFVANVGPTYSDFQHSPAVPRADQTVTVTARANDPNGIASMTLLWSVDGAAWNSTAMTLRADGLYAGTIPRQSAGKVVQFYVRGQDSAGAVSTYPAAGANSRALYQVNDGRGPSTPIDSIRVVMLSADNSRLFVSTNLMNNEDLGATVIYNNSEVFYDVGVRLKGSSYSRRDPAWLGSYALQFHPDQLFRGVHDKISLDATGRGADANGTDRHDEILVNQILNHAGNGLQSVYDDLAYAIVPRNDHTGTVILELARMEDIYLDEAFKDGSDGGVFEYELVYYERNTIDGNVESLKVLNGGGIVSTAPQNLGNDKEKYRWNMLIKNNRDEDDYTQAIAMWQAFSLTGTEFLNTISQIIDVDQWLRTFAVANLMGISDTFATGGNQHNAAFFVRPEDNKVLLFPWDWDESFRLPTSVELILDKPSGPLAKLLTSPEYAHLYYGHLRDLILTTYNTAYLSSWAQSFGSLVGQNYSPDLAYIASRSENVLNLRLPVAAPLVPFNITTNGGNPLTVNTPTAVLSGTGWIDVRNIRVTGNAQPLPITWTAQDRWQVTVPVKNGVNNLTLEAYDFQGNLVHTDTIAVTSTATSASVFDSLRISELMYNPSADPIGMVSDKELFEYVELTNIGTLPLNLKDVRISSGIDFIFPEISLAPGERTVVVKDRAAFELRYGTSLNIAGAYDGSLSNGGERLVLSDANAQTVLDFTYDDESWYPQTDGGGYSLVVANPLAAKSAWDTKTGWRRSSLLQGSPGVVDPAVVFERYVFYNNSAFDGNDADANANDDNAIAPDKRALLPGQTATYANYTSYSRGINGIIVDLAGVNTSLLTTADFRFKTGNTNTPAAWNSATSPASISVRKGEGTDGSDRVTLVWNDWDATANPANEAIAKAWLQVTLFANANTRLAADDVFYFGNAIGDSGNSTSDAVVNTADQLGPRNNPRTEANPAAIQSAFDYDRNQLVNADDQAIARNHSTTLLNALKLISVPALVQVQLLGFDDGLTEAAYWAGQGEENSAGSAPKKPLGIMSSFTSMTTTSDEMGIAGMFESSDGIPSAWESAWTQVVEEDEDFLALLIDDADELLSAHL